MNKQQLIGPPQDVLQFWEKFTHQVNFLNARELRVIEKVSRALALETNALERAYRITSERVAHNTVAWAIDGYECAVTNDLREADRLWYQTFHALADCEEIAKRLEISVGNLQHTCLLQRRRLAEILLAHANRHVAIAVRLLHQDGEEPSGLPEIPSDDMLKHIYARCTDYHIEQLHDLRILAIYQTVTYEFMIALRLFGKYRLVFLDEDWVDLEDRLDLGEHREANNVLATMRTIGEVVGATMLWERQPVDE